MWQSLTIDHVKARMTDTEIECYEAGGDIPTGLRRLDEENGIIEQITAQVRGFVSGCKDNLLIMGSAGTIPEELIWAAAAIARHSLVATIPNLDEFSGEDRTREYNDAMTHLKSVARCQIAIAPETASTPPRSAGCWGSEPQACF